jgi:hypothetical protein
MKTKSIKQEVTLGNYAEFESSEASFMLIRDRLSVIGMRGLKRNRAR